MALHHPEPAALAGASPETGYFWQRHLNHERTDMDTLTINSMIQNANTSPDSLNDILGILDAINQKLGQVEQRVKELESKLQQTANVTSCLANGIKPD